jgi:dTDP-4-amino-4,6-dideoxygalactose transaminase
MAAEVTGLPRQTERAAAPHRHVAFASTPVSDEARAEVARVLASGWLTTGAQTVAFEQEFADHLGVRNAVAVSSCTAALEIALLALHLPDGADVLTPTMTFCGAVHAILHARLHPVLVDVDAQTLVPRPDQVAAAAARSHPAAMVVQHMAGYPVDVAALAGAAGLPDDRVVEDAAHALGTWVGDVPVGRASRAACFSFYATKNLPMGEGGAITTEDDELADFARRVRLHGMSRDAWRRYAPGGGWAYSVDDEGLKANLSDVHAAIGRGQLHRLPAWQEQRRLMADEYDRALAGIPGIALAPRPASGSHAWHLYVVRVTPEFGLHRDQVATELALRGVDTSVHFIPVHRFPYFRRTLGSDGCTGLVEADQAFDQVLSLPMHPGLTADDVGYVAHQLSNVRG